MTKLKVAFVEWPEGLLSSGPEWQVIERAVSAARADILITNEMPFGNWVAQHQTFDRVIGDRSIEAHERGLVSLAKLEVSVVVSSRPLAHGDRLVNEAFALVEGSYQPLHQKHYFPDESGFFEQDWFTTESPGFAPLDICGARIGVLLCTELFFNERAREYGRKGADLIAVPRAVGTVHEHWKIAGAMAAISSGAYVVSSNRVGTTTAGQIFGGLGFAVGPKGQFLGETSFRNSLSVAEIDLSSARDQKSQYPCYVEDRWKHI
jgi:N-carbamoylputrescine amidase